MKVGFFSRIFIIESKVFSLKLEGLTNVSRESTSLSLPSKLCIFAGFPPLLSSEPIKCELVSGYWASILEKVLYF